MRKAEIIEIFRILPHNIRSLNRIKNVINTPGMHSIAGHIYGVNIFEVLTQKLCRMP